MPTRRLGLLVGIVALLGACTQPVADGSGPPAGDPTASSASTTPPAATTLPSPVLPAPTTRPSAPAATPATTALAPPVTTVGGPLEVFGGDPVDDVAWEPDFDEPVFDVEPLAPFDPTGAAPAVDDAGVVGGGPDTGWAAFDRALGAALVANGNTAASVAVAIGGEVVHTAAFGERIPGTGDAAEPHDRFRIASISKTLTAITLLQLVEDGVVGLDEPVGLAVARHLGVERPAAGVEAITVRHLLNHTAGFAKYYGVFFGGGAADCRQAAAIGLSSSLSGAPGGAYRYSNMGYCVAGQLIEALTGQSYERAVYEHLLTPLGLSGLRLANTFDPGPDEILHPTTLGRNYMETLGAAGSWIATPADLVAVLDSLDPSTPGWKPLEPATLAAMTTPVGGSPGQRGYGLGLLLYGPGRYGHTGTIESTHAMVMNRGDGVTWSITVSGPWPGDTPRLESMINAAFAAGGFLGS